jgi:hypothetical protein
VTYHLWLDFYFDEVLSIVDSDSLADEFRQDWDITAVRAYSTASRSAYTIDEVLVFRRKTTCNGSAGTAS